jgi:cell division septum initiation protein DivIVA
LPLERQSIEKRDFPIGRRGYDPDAVDTHLSALADEIDELKRSTRRRSETLASAASEQVRAIVEAAESSAADIQRQAEDDAQEIKAEAAAEAQSTRELATAQARDYVGKVSESTAVMLQRLDAMESELGALIDALRTGSNRLNADLQLLEGNLEEVKTAVVPRPRFEPEPEELSARGSFQPDADTDVYEEQAEPEVVDAVSAEIDYEVYEEEDEEVPAAAGTEDETEGARLIALNMALNGTPRAETDRYLADNFDLRDRATLLDEVYASVEG